MATRWCTSFTVVSSAPISTPGVRRSTWIIHALSLPEDQEARTRFNLFIWLSGYLVIGVDQFWEWHEMCLSNVMSIESERLKQRTLQFALDVLDLVDGFPQKTSGFVV